MASWLHPALRDSGHDNPAQVLDPGSQRATRRPDTRPRRRLGQRGRFVSPSILSPPWQIRAVSTYRAAPTCAVQRHARPRRLHGLAATTATFTITRGSTTTITLAYAPLPPPCSVRRRRLGTGAHLQSPHAPASRLPHTRRTGRGALGARRRALVGEPGRGPLRPPGRRGRDRQDTSCHRVDAAGAQAGARRPARELPRYGARPALP